MKHCEYCKDLNEEKEDIEISELFIQHSYYEYYMPIIYCPVCGKKLKKFEGECSENKNIKVEVIQNDNKRI